MEKDRQSGTDNGEGKDVGKKGKISSSLHFATIFTVSTCHSNEIFADQTPVSNDDGSESGENNSIAQSVSGKKTTNEQKMGHWFRFIPVSFSWGYFLSLGEKTVPVQFLSFPG
jgi:hypothetical protein